MNRHESLLLGILIGAGLMYILDPDRGRRRRALIRDQMVHGAHEIEEFGGGLASRARHLRNRARGVVIETRSRFYREEIADPILEVRVRSELTRILVDASGIAVSSEHGRITLRGMAPDADVDSLIEGVQNVPGVQDVINRMQSRENAG
jgi:hypothetical protein